MWWRYIPISPIFLPLSRIRFKLKATDKGNVPVKGPFIIITNHQTVYDAFGIGLAIPWTIYRNRIVPWAKVDIKRGAEGKVGQYLYIWLRAIPIQRNEEELEETIRLSIKHLKRRELIMIFPEGTRQKYGTVAPFKFGAANLARLMPVPILPVGVYRRREDRGMQVHYGKPFFMPDIGKGTGGPEEFAESAEDSFRREVDLLKQECRDAGLNRKGMRLITRQVRLIARRISEENMDLDRLCKMATEEDNEFLREKIIEALPEGWAKTEDCVEDVK